MNHILQNERTHAAQSAITGAVVAALTLTPTGSTDQHLWVKAIATKGHVAVDSLYEMSCFAMPVTQMGNKTPEARIALNAGTQRYKKHRSQSPFPRGMRSRPRIEHTLPDVIIDRRCCCRCGECRGTAEPLPPVPPTATG